MRYDVELRIGTDGVTYYASQAEKAPLIVTYQPEGPLTEEEAWALEKAVQIVRMHYDTHLYSGLGSAQFVLNIPDQGEGALQLLAGGWRQVSHTHRHLARLPPGKTGLEALAEVSPSSVADIMRRVEMEAADDYLRTHAPEEHQKTLTIEEFDDFLRATGRRGMKSPKPVKCPECESYSWTATCETCGQDVKPKSSTKT